MRKRIILKGIFSAFVVVTMFYASHCFVANTYVKAATADTGKQASDYLNASVKYLHLGNVTAASFDFDIKESVRASGIEYYWYVKTDKGNPESVTINSSNGVVTAREPGTAYIRCRMTLPDGTILRPEARVIVRNNITAVDISNISEYRIVTTGNTLDFDRSILKTEDGRNLSASGITRWETKENTAGAGIPSENGVVKTSKEGTFQIRAICFQSDLKYINWRSDPVNNEGNIIAASKWYTVTVVDSGHQAVAETQVQLDKALADHNVKLVKLSTDSSERFIIGKGNYPDKSIIVDTPNADVENSASFGKIIIQAIKDTTWIEYANGNIIYLDDTQSSIIIDENFEVKEIVIDRPNSVMNIVAKGSIAQITVMQPAQVSVTGNNKTIPITVEETAGGCQIISSVPLSLDIKADTDIKLDQGAEGSVVSKNGDTLNLKIENKTKQEVQLVNASKVKQTIRPGETAISNQGSKDAITPTPKVTPTPTPSTPPVGPVPYTPADQTPVNHSPEAVDDNITMAEDSNVLIAVINNDTDSDHNNLVITGYIQGSHGTVTKEANSLRYTPVTNYHGTDSFDYNISDGNGGSDTATVSIVINAVNDAPNLTEDDASVNEDGNILINVLVNDTDVEGDILTLTSFTQGPHGIVTKEGNSLRYTPEADFHGTVSFSYTVSDGNGGITHDTVTVTVNSVNDIPSAEDDSVILAEDATVLVDVLANDTDTADGDELSLSNFYQGAHGTVMKEGNSLRYTPNPNYFGTDNFSYTVSDGNGGSDTATVSITINSVNDLPELTDDDVSVNEDANVMINVLANDTDVEGDTLMIMGYNTGMHGTVVMEGTSLRYTPEANYYGSDIFSYTVSDGNGGTTTAQVNVMVNSVNDAPVAVNDTTGLPEDATTPVNLLWNDTDTDGDVIYISSFTQGAHGIVTSDGNNLRYTSTNNYYGTDSFEYTISDGNGGSSTATVSVTIYPMNDAPTAVDDVAYLYENSTITIDVLLNDFDLEGDALSIASISIPQYHVLHGIASVEGTTIRYTPDADFTGYDSFKYTVCDDKGASKIATVTITVYPLDPILSLNIEGGCTTKYQYFTVSLGGTYNIQTYFHMIDCDTKLYLYDFVINDWQVMEINDNKSLSDYYSSITTYLEPGIYSLRVEGSSEYTSELYCQLQVRAYLK